ncbi:hypothetical protein A1OO_14685 [Enterovibrio norvegicus FF-33]|uniref:hypothetical protein n=1 Tax=Enterovibrio norvegicus TaxID=188144 RepID=UPI00036DEC87|nr:hypothetical protein [Enterovibrio norvegicus]OEE67007.1 hypothetical protein A1OO_14685 [Enterovibrio norvegicus FF-33]
MYNENDESLGKQAFEALKALLSLPFLLITIVFNVGKIIAAMTHVIWKVADDAAKDEKRKHKDNVVIDVTPTYRSKSQFIQNRIRSTEDTVIYDALPGATINPETLMYDELSAITVVDKVIRDNGKYIVRFVYNTPTSVIASYRNTLASKHLAYAVSYRKGVNTDRMYIQLRPR